jgi:hypothetical protein
LSRLSPQQPKVKTWMLASLSKEAIRRINEI